MKRTLANLQKDFGLNLTGVLDYIVTALNDPSPQLAKIVRLVPHSNVKQNTKNY